MKVFDYRDRDPLPLEALFPTDILDDPWMVYHGTSGALEAEIDTRGIRAARSIVDSNAIERIVGVFERLDWGGTHGGGYPVLAGFSTFDVSQRRPVFLGESALRVTTFAAADFAGGEVVRAVHHALEDLEILASGAWPEDWPSVDRPKGMATENLQLVRDTLDKLVELRGAIQRIRAAHTHGVVYAVRLRVGDIPRLKYNNAMGLMYRGEIPADRLVAKTLVPATVRGRMDQDEQRLRFAVSGPIRRLVGIAEELRSKMPGLPEDVLAAALEAAVRKAG